MAYSMTNADPDGPFPEADVDGELHSAKPRKFPIDPVSSDVDTSKELQKQAKIREEGKEVGRREAMQAVKSRFIISGVIVAVVAAGLMLFKKVKQT